jgi:hypothetical protein
MPLQYSIKNLPKQIFINNEYVDSKNSKKLTLHNPKDGSLIADDVPLAGEQDVDAAVAAAEKAFVGWRKMGATERRNILLKFAQLSRISLGAPASFGAFEGGLCAEVSFQRCLPMCVSENKLTDKSRRLDTMPALLTSLVASHGHKKTASSRLYATSRSV